LRSPIFFAIAIDKYEIVEMFLSLGASTTFRDKFGRTLIHYIINLKLENKYKLLRIVIDYTHFNEKKEIE